jgi:hypothetical protein
MEQDVLLALRNDKDITILPTDKDNATVVLLSEDYHNKIQHLLIKKSDIWVEVVKKLTPYASAPPRLYRLPKVHKKDVPLRPIVSCISSPTYTLTKYLTDLFSLLVGQSSHHIENLEAFV